MGMARMRKSRSLNGRKANKKSIRLSMIFTLLLGGWAGCTPKDSERCGGPTYWNDEYKSCLPVTDAGDDAGKQETLPEGLGEPCTTLGLESECADFEAAYCVKQPGKTRGYCTLHECTPEPNDCPNGYRCCDMTVPGMPNFCATTDDYFLMGSMCAK
jgi:hypothetical protein